MKRSPTESCWWNGRVAGLLGSLRRGAFSVCFGVCWTAAAAGAEAPNAEPDEELSGRYHIEEVVTIGTRVRARAAADTAVPVDVFGSQQVDSVNSSDLVEVLSAIVPSFNARRQPISDGASFIRPVHLRGLDSHHILVLVDGKRRHRAALMQLGGFGAHGVDVGSIPSIAIDAVEVLRDGAAAQYGSDAIAGVLNFRLRTDDAGFDLRARAGGYTEGDGDEATLEGNVGFPLGASGFANVSAQFSRADPTSRSEPYDIGIGGSGLTPLQATGSSLTVDGVTYHGPDALIYTYSPTGEILQAALGSDGIPDDLDTRFADNFHRIGGGRSFGRPAQVWGQPEREQAMFFVNAALPLGPDVELYGFTSHATKDQTGGFFYRRPGVAQLLPVRLADGSIHDPRAALYPAGFTPQFSGDVIDYAAVLGMRGERASGFTFDLSAGYGSDEIRYRIANTMNPSLGPDTPTRFRPGNLVNEEVSVNADFTLALDAGLATPVNFAFGFEYREEGYRIERGNPQSYAVGPFARPDPFNFEITRAEVDADPADGLVAVECRIPGFEAVGALCPEGDPINNAVPVGSNGFPGYPPTFASDVERRSHAAYVDLEADLTDRWLGNAAVRYEDFSDFGAVTIGKVATRFRLTGDLNVRASMGTGFRAPTPGQISTTNVSTRVNAEGLPQAEGIFPSTHPAAALFGGIALDAERSRSFTLGLAATLFDELDLTLDYYRIRLDDRIVLSSQFAVGPVEAAQLSALGVPGATDIAQVRFFTNDVDTQTSGLDLVANWHIHSRLGITTLQGAFNLNRTKLLARGRYVDAEAEHDIEQGVPALQGVLTASHTRGRLDLMLRARYYGEYENTLDTSLATTQDFGAEALVDVEAAWTFRDRYAVKLGVENVFDNYPDKGAFEVCCGRIYRSDSIMPWQGTLLYLQLGIGSL